MGPKGCENISTVLEIDVIAYCWGILGYVDLIINNDMSLLIAGQAKPDF